MLYYYTVYVTIIPTYIPTKITYMLLYNSYIPIDNVDKLFLILILSGVVILLSSSKFFDFSIAIFFLLSL